MGNFSTSMHKILNWPYTIGQSVIFNIILEFMVYGV
jgi:hypothetical protein